MTRQEKYNQALETLKTAKSELLKSKEHFTAFLDTAAWTYKYNFNDQLLIFNTKPNATMVATFEFWTDTQNINRHINKGVNSVVLPRSDGEILNLYDVMDTSERFANGRSKSKSPEILTWHMEQSDEVTVSHMLSEKYEINSNSFSDSMVYAIQQSAASTAEKYLPIGLDQTTKSELKFIIQDAAAYLCLKRCGISYNAEHMFENVQSFNSSQIADLIGNIVNKSSKEFLGEISKIVPTDEKKQQIERSAEYGNRREILSEVQIQRGRQQDVRSQGRNNVVSSEREDRRENGSEYDTRRGRDEILAGVQSGERSEIRSGQQTRPLHIPRDRTGGNQGTSDSLGDGGREKEIPELERNGASRADGGRTGGGRTELHDVREVRGYAQGLAEELPSDSVQYSESRWGTRQEVLDSQQESKGHDRQSSETLGGNGERISESTGESGLHENAGIEEQLYQVSGGNDTSNDSIQPINNSENTAEEPKTSAVSVSEDGIIGNTKFRYIRKKQYTKLDTPFALKVAEHLEASDIKYSGHISGNTTTITVDKIYLSKLQDIIFDLRLNLKSDLNEIAVDMPVKEKNDTVVKDEYVVNDDEQMSFFGLAEEKPKKDNLSSYAYIPSEIKILPTRSAKEKHTPVEKITERMVDNILSSGGNEFYSNLRIIAYYMKGKSTSDNAEFLSREYKTGGKGFLFGDKAVSTYWYNETGIYLGAGDTALTQKYDYKHMTWTEVAERIGEMLDNGRYASQEQINKALDRERQELSEKLWYLHQDCEIEYFIPQEMFAGGFPDSTVRIAEALKDTDILHQYQSGMENLISKYNENRDVLRFHFHKLDEILGSLKDLQLPQKTFTAQQNFEVKNKLFITQDEINELIFNGSGMQDGKFRINEFFSTHHEEKEQVKFLKNEYGIGGYGNIKSHEWHDGKGISFERSNENGTYDHISISWQQAAKQISEYVRNGVYITQKDIDERISHANFIIKNYKPNDDFGGESIKKAQKILDDYGVKVEKDQSEQITILSADENFYEEKRQKLMPIMEQMFKEDFKEETPFEKLKSQHNFNERQLQLINRLEKLINKNHMDAFSVTAFSGGLWRSTYGSIKNIDDMFDGNIEGIINELNDYLKDSQPTVKDFEDDVKEGKTISLFEYSQALQRENSKKDELDLDFGDEILFEGRHFRIEKITDSYIENRKDISMRDLDSRYPISRAIDSTQLINVGYEKIARDYQVIVYSDDSGEDEKMDWGTFAEAEKDALEYLKDDYYSGASIYNKRTQKIESVYGLFPTESIYSEDVLIANGYEISKNDNIEKSVDTSITANEILVEEPAQAENYHITESSLGGGGAKTKYHANVDAIRTLKAIESENRFATPEEKDVLAKYVGWGGVSQAFDNNNDDWQKEYFDLRKLLTVKEYGMAIGSVLTAYYTSPTVINAMYKALGNMGFKGGNILEPSMGIGNFFGMMPQDLQKNSKLFGVEIDDLTGRISKKLYPNANITISGFEKTSHPDNFFDVAIGNVPFGDFNIADQRYDKYKFKVHDYFFAKALDKVKPGGVVAFITSKGTLDKANSSVRKYLAQRAELIGAVRLPNDAFKAIAGTEVTSDIIFLKKREKIRDIEPDWCFTGKNEDGFEINQYFVDHPEMILGELVKSKVMYGREDTVCIPIHGANLAKQLETALGNIKAEINTEEYVITEENAIAIPADPNVRNYSFTVLDNKIFIRKNTLMFEQPIKNEKDADRIKGMIAIRDCTRDLMQMQLNDYSDDEIQSQRDMLNKLYDSFSKQYGLLNSRTNAKAFSEDISYPLLCSIEILDKNGNLECKGDIFTKRVIKADKTVDKVDNAEEALIVSISEKAKVDLDFMEKLSGLSKEKIIANLKGSIYRLPILQGEPQYVTEDEYLSGNILTKLNEVKAIVAEDSSFNENITALEKAMPIPLEAGDISVRLGASWIEPKYIQQFVYELLDTPQRFRPSQIIRNPNAIEIEYAAITSEWRISNKTIDFRNTKNNTTYGTSRKNAYEIIQNMLNQRDTKVWDTIIVDGKETRKLNGKETTLVNQKIEAIQQAFKDWVFAEPERRQHLVKRYNEMFNSTRPREYDGSHLKFSGINPEIELREHQKNAIAHALYGGNTLFAHEVGAGKTFEIIASAMEGKRLGLHSKSLICVPNHLTEQMGEDFLELYPNANILVATKKDFQKENRKKLCAKIATGDFDAVIIGHSQLKNIPVSEERQEKLLNKQIDEIIYSLEQAKLADSESFTVKQMEKTKKKLEEKLKKLTNSDKGDGVVTFEELGIDKMYVDEAHKFKNLFLYTKMNNVAGVQQTEAEKATDLYMKCQYLDEITNYKGTVFATGTPVSNSMTEVYTMQRYLQSDVLKTLELSHFDSWASDFGETVSALELAPEGSGYRIRTRFAKFYNLPELMNIFKECADIKTVDTMGLKVPNCELINVCVEPSDVQTELIKSLSERAEQVHNRLVEPNVDNMLKITTDGRKIGLDQRLINPMLPDNPDSKVNACINNVFNIWEETKADRLTQLIFCDFSTPNGDGFNLYDDIKEKLMKMGVPAEEVVFIHDAKTEDAKSKLFEKVRNGDVRVLIGSTEKMGAGTNVQKKLIASHDLDCPWKPSDMIQRAGRMIRQGNDNNNVRLFRYVTNSTFDAYLFQTLETKQKFISQIMTEKNPLRSCEDLDKDSLSYAETKALCAGDPRIAEKMNLDIEVAKLQLLKTNYNNTKYRLEDQCLKEYPNTIKMLEKALDGTKKDIELIKSYKPTFDIDGNEVFKITVNDVVYNDKEKAGEALMTACRSNAFEHTSSADKIIGEYKGFKLSAEFDTMSHEFVLYVKGKTTHQTRLGQSAVGNISRLNNLLESIVNPKYTQNVETQLTETQKQLADAKAEIAKSFPQDEELKTKSARLEELNTLLDISLADSVQDNGVYENDESVEETPQKPSKEMIDKLFGNAADKEKNDDLDLSKGYSSPKM